MVSINELPAIIIVIVVAGILAGVGVLVLDEIRTDMSGATNSFNIQNETITITAAGVDLTVRSLTDLSSLVFTNITDGDLPEILNSSSIIVNTTGIENGVEAAVYTAYLEDIIQAGYEGKEINLSYSGTDYSTEGNAFLNSTQGIANITAQIPTVGVIIGVSLIVMVILLLFVAIPKKTY